MSLITATIRTDALRHNLAMAREAAAHSRVMAVIKANAYGHGASAVAAALHEADAFAVARLEEALQLRQSGIAQPIVVLSELLDAEKIEACAEHDLQPVVHDLAAVETLLAKHVTRRLGKVVETVGAHSGRCALTLWLKVDTGMHRLGVAPDDCERAYRQLVACPHVDEVRVMTHFSSADEADDAGVTDGQINQLSRATSNLSGIQKSLANSAAVLAHKRSHAEWIRPGLMLYGADPLAKANDLSARLRPVMQWHSRVIAVHEIAAGEVVGYNGTWRSERRSRIGTIACGYADGYPRHARNGTPVAVDGNIVPLAGRVSMDTLTVDLTDHPGAGIGSTALLWGDQLPAERVAECAATIPYQLFTAVGGRTRFVYTE